jgi:hypothetical protein
LRDRLFDFRGEIERRGRRDRPRLAAWPGGSAPAAISMMIATKGDCILRLRIAAVLANPGAQHDTSA